MVDIMPLTALVSVLALIVYLWISLNVGRARSRFDVKAPAISGHPEFERYIRVQANTVEQIVLYLPALWLFAFFVSDPWAAAIGLVWPVGRIIYARSYYKDPASRGPGFLMTFGTSLVLLAGALVGAILTFL